MSYHKVGVFGSTGPLGQEVTRALVDAGFDVVPFSRQSTIVAGIPTQTLGSLVGFDVIVCTVGHAGMREQIPLIELAKKDGVKRFIPSEFGVNHRLVTSDFFQAKMDIFEAVKAADFPDGWTAISNGFFDSVISDLVETKLELSKIVVHGGGQKVFPFSSRYDTGRVLASVFKSPAEYKNTWLNLANGWYSLGEIAQFIREQSQELVDIEYVALDSSTPVLQLLEENDLPIFDRKDQTMDVPVDFVDMKKFFVQV